jgi:predicted transcriptional regulator
MPYNETADTQAKKGQVMRRSKLELYQDIICALAQKAETADSLAFECSTDCTLLQQRMQFLVQNNIVTIEVSRDNLAFYVLTRRGVAIAKTLSMTKRLDKLKTLQTDDAFTLIPAFPDEEKPTRKPA